MKLATKAHLMVAEAISSGQLVRPSVCEECSKTRKVVAHHDDYTKPLDVRWLCNACHRTHHNNNPSNHSDLGIQVRISPENLKALQEWTSGLRIKVSVTNAANMFMAEGIATIKKQGAK